MLHLESDRLLKDKKMGSFLEGQLLLRTQELNFILKITVGFEWFGFFILCCKYFSPEPLPFRSDLILPVLSIT